MTAESIPLLKQQLLERRNRLQLALRERQESATLRQLLGQVDDALANMAAGTWGLCEVCHDPIEPDRLLADPTVRFCLDHLTPDQQRSLEHDLQLAARMQQGLLPPRSLSNGGWEIAYHYQPAGMVSGDYCDLIRSDALTTHFVVGDVSGKGLAASMLMAHLHAMFRSLLPRGTALKEMMELASRVFCESTLPSTYATLICGRLADNGEVAICNAGHPPALRIHRGTIAPLPATGLPLGMFCDNRFEVHSIRMEQWDMLIIYTDGVSETTSDDGHEYGLDGIIHSLNTYPDLGADDWIHACMRDLAAFRGKTPLSDDISLMAIRRIQAAF